MKNSKQLNKKLRKSMWDSYISYKNRNKYKVESFEYFVIKHFPYLINNKSIRNEL
jgi:hypothetical protein